VKTFCPFCKPFKHSPLLESNFFLVIEDLYPISNGHLLIISRRHIESYFLTTSEEKMDLIKIIEKTKALIDKKLNPDGYNIGINDGEAAGQTINHLHIHVIPRYKGDSEDPRGGIRWIFPDKAPYWKSNE
jgi:diadenosine tetraphosphate (Ap4A) HIT family hydrolase